MFTICNANEIMSSRYVLAVTSLVKVMMSIEFMLDLNID